MALYTSLRLAISQAGYRISKSIEQSLDFLLTQTEDFIVTQDERNIVFSHLVIYSDILTQDDFSIVTQNNRQIKAIS